ncbi:hypothetical protein [Streptomyces decoyicus]
MTHAPYGSAHMATRQPRHTGQPWMPGGSVFSALLVSNMGNFDLAHTALAGAPQNVHGIAAPPASSGANIAAISLFKTATSRGRPACVTLAFGYSANNTFHQS